MNTNTMIHTNSQVQCPPMGRTQPRGYTMIDMLVSMSIIMLLIATLLPALSQVRRASKRAVCMTHEFELGKFIERSAQEHNGYFPMFQYNLAYDAQSLIVSTTTRDFREAGMDYFADAQVLCPSDDQPGNISFLNAQNQVQIQAMSYGMNIDLLVQNVRIYDLRDASRTITMYDGSMSGPADGGKSIEGVYTGSFDMIDYARTNRHYKETNVLYADGHVERKLRMNPVNLAAVGDSTFVAASYATNTTGGGNGTSLDDDDDDHDNNGASSDGDDDDHDNNGASSDDDDDD
ncbi:type II secretion system protein, partial [bacterium AH-315-I18]|nr:type II secretion system protein [bacterium AH-315-I18]